MMKAFALCLGFFVSLSAHAGYFVGLYGNGTYNARTPTHFVVTGNGSELKTLFQYAGAAKAMKLQELYPDDQVILVAYNQTPGETTNRDQLISWNFQILADRSDVAFSSTRLIQEFLHSKKIASIDIYTHNSFVNGSSLEDFGHPLSQNTTTITQIKGNLTADAYIILHGCNTGFYFAPAWSQYLGIPVAGSFTSTKFERLHSNGNFYSYDETLMPKTGDWAQRNKVSYEHPMECNGAGCMRMKPDYFPYTGIWGDYNKGGGLPFFKFFCVNVRENRCLHAMSTSLFGFISTRNYQFNASYADYKNLLKDFLCPLDARNNIRQQCSNALDRAERGGDRTYKPFLGKMLTCDFTSCHAEVVCDKNADGSVIGKSCTVDNQSDDNSTAFVDEYLTYLKAYSYLRKSPSSGIFGGLFN